jgi:hypothetical protein
MAMMGKKVNKLMLITNDTLKPIIMISQAYTNEFGMTILGESFNYILRCHIHNFAWTIFPAKLLE